MSDLDIFLDYGSQGTGWWTWSNGDNAGSGNYTETLDVNLWTMETFTLAVQAWPTTPGSTDYRLIIRAAP